MIPTKLIRCVPCAGAGSIPLVESTSGWERRACPACTPSGREAGTGFVEVPIPGVELIAAERSRQIEEEGWVPTHDDEHDDGSLTRAASCYTAAALVALRAPINERRARDVLVRFGIDPETDDDLQRMRDHPVRHYLGGKPPRSGVGSTTWPWADDDWKPSPTPLRNLVKAGALIAAEIDRIARKQ